MNTREFINRRLPYTIKAQHYAPKDTVPKDQDTGVPLTFKKQHEDQKSWYKQWHKAANRVVASDEENPVDDDEVSKYL